jgi:hypothetical protein
MWFFGGQGIVSGGGYGYTNELWKLYPDGALVAFIGGTQTPNSSGTYTGPNLWPSARTGSASCLASNGILWLYGI